MSKQNLIRIFFFIIMFSFAYMFYSQYKEVSQLRLKSDLVKKSIAKKNIKAPITKDKFLAWKENNKALSEQEKLSPPLPLLSQEQSISPSVMQFIKETHLDITLPTTYSYSYIEDLQVENIEVGVLSGTEGSNSIYVIGARYIIQNIRKLFQELSENTHLFVSLNKQDLLGLVKSNINSYPSKPGIKSIYLLKHNTAKKFIYAAYLIRKDSRGSYIILVSSSRALAEQTLFSILLSAKPL